MKYTRSPFPCFCPECKAECRPGFTRCSDCDVELVEALSQSDNSAENELTYRNSEAIKRAWSGKDQDRCVFFFCERHKKAGIPFKVDQRQYLLRVDEQYKIGVPPKFFNDAGKIIKGASTLADRASHKRAMELPGTKSTK